MGLVLMLVVEIQLEKSQEEQSSHSLYMEMVGMIAARSSGG